MEEYKLVEKLIDAGVKLYIDDGKLKIKAPKNFITHELKNEIDKYKNGIIKILEAKTKSNVIVKKAEKKEYYDVSESQNRLFFLSKLDSSSTAYNMPISYSVTGNLDEKLFKGAFLKIVVKHESLRSTFKIVNGEVKQFISEQLKPIVNFVDSTILQNEEADSLIEPFNIEKGPLFRAYVIKKSTEEYILLLDMHHIISDGISQNFLIEDFLLFYNNTHNNNPKEYKYVDYTEYQKKREHSSGYKVQKKFWLENFSGKLPILDLPLDYVRQKRKKFEGFSLFFEIGEKETQKLRLIAKKENTTLFVILFSSFNILLSKLSSQNDIITSCPISGRNNSYFEKIVGFFTKVLPLRNYPRPELSIKSFIAEVKKRYLDAFDNQDFTYDNLLKELDVNRDFGHNPLFDVMFSLQNEENDEFKLPNLQIKTSAIVHQISKFDLTLFTFDNEANLKFNLEYDSNLFKEQTIQNFANYYIKILEYVINQIDIDIGEMSILNESEKQQILHEFNRDIKDESSSKHIIDLIFDQGNKNPEKIALQYKNTTLSYERLIDRINCLTNYFIENEIEEGDIVGLYMDKSEEMIISILATLNLGAIYVSLDINYPSARLKRIIADSGLSNIVSTEEVLLSNGIDYGSHTNVNEIRIDKIPNYPNKPNIKRRSLNNIAYILYTSGTSGNPKGVVVTNKNLSNYINWASQAYVTEESAFPLFTTVSFDLTVTSIFVPLVTGNKIIIYKDDSSDVLIKKVLSDNLINVIKLTPSHLNIIKDLNLNLKEDEIKLKKIIVGGEELDSYLANKIYNNFNKNIEIFNEYGPTETTVGCMLYKFSPEDNLKTVPIGKPIKNTRIYFLDTNKNLVPNNIPGELYISGESVAKGYLNLVEQTHESFLKDPYFANQTMYKSGDQGRLLPGLIGQFIGRLDDQVKINGYRVELKEIEKSIESYPDIKNAICVLKPVNSSYIIYAYYIANVDIDLYNIKNFLKDLLPDYMTPAYYLRIQDIPLNHHGKLDYNSLPEIINEDKVITNIPKNKIEKNLIKMWNEVLNVDLDKIRLDSNFFEIGGSSISSIIICNRIKVELQVDIELVKFFELPTIQQIANYIYSVCSNKNEDNRNSSVIKERRYDQRKLRKNK